jgi:hypothetical protein
LALGASSSDAAGDLTFLALGASSSEGPDDAIGQVSSHAEVVRNGDTMVTAMRYYDAYRRTPDGRWRFADRCIHFFYYLPVANYREALVGRGRMRAYGDIRDAELPEGAWA